MAVGSTTNSLVNLLENTTLVQPCNPIQLRFAISKGVCKSLNLAKRDLQPAGVLTL
jgi:hypothetical protein